MKREMNTKYDPKEFEQRISKMWEENEYFTAKIDKNLKPFTILMPPPNITGKLHLGHALNNTIQDTIIRIKRMQGYSALWLPGEDHASIATEVRVEKELLEKGIKKKELGREKFLDEVYNWSDKYRAIIRDQLKKIGSSADFSREAFTMDENLSKAVRHVFVKMFKDGLIYRGNRITNWCPCCMTAISDAEIEHEEKQGNFYHMKYYIKGEDKYVEVATTRPETILGDVAIAINPKDPRRNDLLGKTVILPLVGREIPIIEDEYVDLEFGTGVVKITPAHDPNDFNVGKRHNLEEIVILNKEGKVDFENSKYHGLDRYEARKMIIEDLKNNDLMVKIVPHTHNVGTHDRCNTVIEPMISSQWYVKMETLAKPALEVVRNGKVEFVPKRFEKIYFNWMENIQDWCISRQLWWGHRIPVWYCEKCGEVICSEDDIKECTKCGNKNIHQDEDVLDTWFSSALWSFSTLGWPEKTPDLDYFSPTSVLVTASDIIFFWVARMIFSSLYNINDIPFSKVLITGIIRDEEGRKMSKSLGNGIDPLDVIENYGADALRYMLITTSSFGTDSRFIEEKVESGRNFANKLWNASRFVSMNIDKDLMEKYKDSKKYTLADKWIMSKMNSLILEINDNIEKYELSLAFQKVYDFVKNEFCDYYIEVAKGNLFSEDEEVKAVTLNVLYEILIKSLKLLYPVMPFITEEINSYISFEDTKLAISNWPEVESEKIDEQSVEAMEIIFEAVRAIRNARSEINVKPSKKAKLIAVVDDKVESYFKNGSIYFEKLASASETVTMKDKKEIDTEKMVAVTFSKGEIYIPLLELIDLDTEIQRLEKEKEKLEGEIKRVTSKLSNEKFVSKAPESVINEEREKDEKYRSMLKNVEDRIKSLQDNKE